MRPVNRLRKSVFPKPLFWIKEVLQELIGFWASYADCVNAFLAAYQQTEEAK